MRNSLGLSPLLDADGLDVDETGGLRGFEATLNVHGAELGIVKVLTLSVTAFRKSGTHLSLGGATEDSYVALVDSEADGTVDRLLGCGEHGEKELGLGRVEETVVKNLRETNGDELVTKGTDIAIESQPLEVHVSGTKNSGTRGFVASTGLDTDVAVLDNVDPSNTVLAGKSVESEEDLNRVGDGLVRLRESDLDRNTLLEVNSDSLRGLRGLAGVGGQLPHVIRGSLVGVLEDAGLIRDVEQVLVCHVSEGSCVDRDVPVDQGLA